MKMVDEGAKARERVLREIGDRVARASAGSMNKCGRCGTRLRGNTGGMISLSGGLQVALCYSCAKELEDIQNLTRRGSGPVEMLRSGARNLAEAIKYAPTSDHLKKKFNMINNVLSKYDRPSKRLVKMPSRPNAKYPVRKTTDSTKTRRIPKWIGRVVQVL